MKRKLRIDSLIENDLLVIYGKDWVSSAMDLDKYENELALITVDAPTDFELEVEVDENDKDILLIVSHKFYISVQMKIMLGKYMTHITLNRMPDPVYQ